MELDEIVVRPKPSDSHLHALPNLHSEADSRLNTGVGGDKSVASLQLLGEPGRGEGEIQGEQETESDGIPPLDMKKSILLLIGLSLGTFVVGLDNTILATAIPQITSDFNSLEDVGWYGSAYLLTTAALQPTFGKIYAFFNIKAVYLAAFVIFGLGSVVCAVATSSEMLIIGRAVAGIGGAALFSGGLTILGVSIPLRQRAMFSGIMTSTFGLAAVIGPLLGGAFTDRVTWRWCFWINLPFGAVTMLAVILWFPNHQRRPSTLTLSQKFLELDLVGAAFLIPGIVCLLLALQWGGTVYPWGDSRVWGCLLGFGLIITVFVGLQVYRGDKATIPPRVFTQRTVLCSCLYLFLLTMGIYTHFYFLPFYFQAVQTQTAEGSGIRTLPYIVLSTVFAIIAGVGTTISGYFTPFMVAGGAIFTIGSGLLITLEVSTSTGMWVGYQLLAGAGAGMALQTPFFAVQAVVNEADLPIGNALTAFFNTCGAAISVSVAQNIFAQTLVEQLTETVPQINPEIIVGAGATRVAAVTPPKLLPLVLEAYNEAVTTAFIYAIATGGVAFIFSLGVEWKSVKGKKLSAAAA